MSRITIAAAGLGGLCWTVKVITLVAGTDALEAPLFIGGLVLLVAAAVLVGRDLRWWLAPLAIAGTIGLEALGITVVGGLYDGGNAAIEEEGGILLAGLAWLLVSFRAAAARAAGGLPAMRPRGDVRSARTPA